MPFLRVGGACHGATPARAKSVVVLRAASDTIEFTRSEKSKDAKEIGYLSKDYIDSLVQSVFVSFNTEFSTEEIMPDVMVRKQRDVISQAKTVATRLRTLAQRDANRQYILWKVGELEEQIWLEEKGLMLKEQNKRQKMVNELIDQFNAETAKQRPDFIGLMEILKRIQPIDQRKADELEQLINIRNRNISREVLYSIEKALESGDLGRARSELDYCEINREELQSTHARVRHLDSLVRKRMSISDERRVLDADVKNLTRLISANRLANGWRIAMNIRGKLDGLSKTLTSQEIDLTNRRIDSLLLVAGTKEDSLVQHALMLLEVKGVDTAMNYVEFVMPRIGVASQKIGIVDLAILRVVRQRNGEEYNPVSKEFAGLPDSAANGEALLGGMMEAARKKSQARQDSLRAIEEVKLRKERARLEREEAVRRKAEEKVQRKMAEEEKRRQVQQERARRDSLKTTDKVLGETIAAQQCMTDIYLLIEKNQIKEAYNLFLRNREKLKKLVIKEAYESLENTVIDSYAAGSAQ